MRTMAIALLIAFPAVAEAGKQSVDQAEVRRLSSEMEKLAKRNAWSGVDRSYAQLLALKQPVPHSAHMLGAHSAQAQGDVMATWRRLQAALEVKRTQEALDWWATIEATYSRVIIKVADDYDEVPALRSLDPMFDPAMTNVVQSAGATLQEKRKYDGLMPLGRYEIGPMQFDSYGGPTQEILVHPERSSKRELGKPPPIAPISPAYLSPAVKLTLEATAELTDAEYLAAVRPLREDLMGLLDVNAVSFWTPPPDQMLIAFDQEALERAQLTSTAIADLIQQTLRLPVGRLDVTPEHIVILSAEGIDATSLSLTDLPAPAEPVEEEKPDPEAEPLPTQLRHVATVETRQDPSRSGKPSIVVELHRGADLAAAMSALSSAMADNPLTETLGLPMPAPPNAPPQ